MNGLFILYGLSFVPLSGPHSVALDTARRAAFVQSGVGADWSTARAALESRVPPNVHQVGMVGAILLHRQLDLHSRTLQFTTSPGRARAVFTLAF